MKRKAHSGLFPAILYPVDCTSVTTFQNVQQIKQRRSIINRPVIVTVVLVKRPLKILRNTLQDNIKALMCSTSVLKETLLSHTPDTANFTKPQSLQQL